MEEILESVTGYSCPNCGRICSDHTLVSRTEPVFAEYPDYHYEWDETHKCLACETTYIIHNGT